MRRWLTIVLLILLIFVGLAGLGLYALMRWNWGGPYLLSLMQARINGKVTAGEISGNPFTGITYKDFGHRRPRRTGVFKGGESGLAPLAAIHFCRTLDSEPMLGLSITLLHAVQVSGHWNTGKLLKPEAPPDQGP